MSFSGTPRYRIVYKNEKGFNIGFNFILIPASVCTLGKGDPGGMDCHITRNDGALFAIKRAMDANPNLHVTLPNMADDNLIDSIF